MKSIFAVYKQIYPETKQSFMIAETNFTSDGPRTRICEGRYDTEGIAFEIKKGKEELELAQAKVSN